MTADDRAQPYTDTERLDWIERNGVSIRARQNASSNCVTWWATPMRDAIDLEMAREAQEPPK